MEEVIRSRCTAVIATLVIVLAVTEGVGAAAPFPTTARDSSFPGPSRSRLLHHSRHPRRAPRVIRTTASLRSSPSAPGRAR